MENFKIAYNNEYPCTNHLDLIIVNISPHLLYHFCFIASIYHPHIFLQKYGFLAVPYTIIAFIKMS